MEREKLVLTNKEAKNIVFGDTDDYEIIQDRIVSHGRWSVTHEVVIQRLSDGKYFSDGYSVGATESQYESPYDYGEPNFIEVFPIETTIIAYE